MDDKTVVITDSEPKKIPKVKKLQFPWGIVTPLVISIVCFVLLHSVFMLAYIPSASMTPTLKEGSFCFAYRLDKSYQVGDVVIFNFSESEDGSRYLVKRIKAIAGETVEWDGETYTVPDGCVLMAGDNAENSYDSRYWKNPYISATEIVGKVIIPNTEQ